MNGLWGRTGELARATDSLERAIAGDGGALLLVGEPGIGKSRLAREIETIAATRGATVVWGRCWEVGGAPALWPWVEVLGALGEDLFAGLPGGADGGHDQRFAVFQRATALLRAATERAPLLVVLDDMHAADVPSLHLLLFVARSLRGARLLVVVTARDVESRASAEAASLFAKIGREATTLALPRLGRDDVAAWLAAQADARDPDEIHRLSDGNPLFVEEMLRVGAGRPALTHGLSAVLDEHLSRLSSAGRALLARAAVLGREFARAHAASLADLDPDDAEVLLREAEHAGVVSRAHERAGFTHVLLRDRLYDTLRPSERAALHRRAADVLARHDADAVTVAHHLLAGAATGDGATDAALAALRGAERATAQLAFEAAVDLCERVLALPPDALDARIRCDVELALADALSKAGDPRRARAAADRAAALARQLDDAQSLARAALTHSAEMASATVDPDMVARLEEALAALSAEPSPLRARVTARLAAALVPPPTIEQGMLATRLAREARDMAQAFDADTRLYCLRFAASSTGYSLGATERLALSEEIVSLARERKQVLIFMQAAGWHAVALAEIGRHAEADALVAELGETLTALPQPFHRWRWFATRAALAAVRGDFEESERFADEFARLAADGGNLTGKIAWALHRCSMAFMRGDPASIARDEAEVLGTLARALPLRPYIAWVHAALGRMEQATQALGNVADEQYALNFPWTIVAGDTAAMIGDPALCEPIYRHLTPERLRQRFFWGPAGSFAFGPTPLVLARLAHALGRVDDARTHYDEAIAMCREARMMPALALAERELAALGGAPRRPAVVARRVALRRDGDTWAVESDGAGFRVKHSKGIEYLDALLARPGHEVFVLTLIGAEHGPSDAGAILDDEAKRAYRARLEDLAEELAEAERFNDAGRACRAREDLDAIAGQLAGAVGLGGRDRKAGSHVERARVNVQRRVKDAIARIAAHDPDLGRYLEATVKTGTFCSFRPI